MALRHTMHCQKELERDLGYDGLLPDSTLFKWFNDSYSTSKHFLTLYSIVRGLHAKTILEIGFGRSSFVLARAAHENGGRLLSCDRRNFSSLFSSKEEEVTEYIYGTSDEVWKNIKDGIDFAFLDYFSDSSLSEDFCVSEIRQCLKHMKTNGVIAIHDVMVDKYPLKRAVEKLIKEDFEVGANIIEYTVLPFNYGLGLIRYKGPSKYGTLSDGFIKKPDKDDSAVLYQLDHETFMKQKEKTTDLSMRRIVFITDKDSFDSKMSRVRFHSMRAIFNHDEVNGIYTGPNWPNWNPSLPAQENLENILKGDWCDLVVCYGPSKIKSFPEIKYKKCIRYNETYDKELVKEEVSKNKIDTIIFHHYNDYLEYKNIFKNHEIRRQLNSRDIKTIRNEVSVSVDLFWIPHSAEKTIFKPNHNVDKVYDVALIGAVDATTMLGDHYPLRLRMSKLLKEMPTKYNCATIPHVGGSHSDAHTDKYAYDFADKINSSKIIITDSGVPKSRFGKYIEVPMCGTALAGDIYEDHPDDIEKLKTFLIDINMQMSDEEIINKLVFYLENEEERQKLIKNGIEYTKDFTHERYAERFLNVLEKITTPMATKG